MFGSTNPFGQSSNSPFGSSLGFGQSNAANNNPFAPKPFGSTTPFGSQQPGGSMFGGTSTGVFGPSQSSPTLTSMPAFGASSSPSFGTSVPAFGASSTPAFGSSAFGQKPAFGGFGSNTAQPSPFGSTFQQSQPAFGNNMFGSSNQFSASSQPAFGASSTPAFGATSTPAFGSTTSPVFGSTGSVFGVSAAPVFGSGGAFGVSNTPAFGASSTPAFGASSAPSFGFGSSPAFGQSTSAFGSSTFGTSTSPFGAQSSAFGAQATTPSFGSSGFGQSAFGGQRGGSRVASYSSTPEVDGGTSQPAGKLESISAMPVYKEKSHEELRWEDYQLGDKGGPSPAAGQSAVGATGFGATNTQPNPFATSSAFGQSSANAFSSTMSSNPFAPNPSSFGSSGFGSSTTATFGSSPFGASTTSNPFGSSSSGTTSIFSASATTFGSNSSPSLFGSSSTPAFASTPSLFGSGPAPGTTSAFGSGSSFGNTQSSPLFQSTTPSLGQTNPIFGQTGSSFGQSTPAFGQSNFLSTPSTGFGGNLFSSSPSLISTGNPMGFGQTTPAQPAQTAGSFGFGNFGQTQSVGTSGFGGTPSIYGQNTFGQIPPTQSSVVAQPVAVTNPFGTLPAMPQMSIGRSGTAPSVQYGISSLLVVDKPAPARISSLLTSRHLSQRRIRLPARKYVHKNDGPKVPFFIDDEETSTTPKADAVFIPRENPRALVIRPSEQWPPRTNSEKISPLKNIMTPNYNNGNASRVVSTSMQESKVANQEKEGNGKEVDGSSLEDKGENGVKKNKEAGILVNEQNGAGIESHIPKLGQSDYYTVPRIQEIAAKERAEPGFCRHVSDFVVGRHGFGSIKFIGSDTDVRGLDIESIVQFNNREVIVYMDETKKPPVGQGLNKPAEVTLLNVKCFDKKTGHQYTQGPKIARYIDMLKKKAEDQGAEFVSYDPIKGEWKFRVNHFSAYRLDDEEKDHRCAC